VHVSSGLSTLLLAPLRPAPLRGIQLGGSQLARSLAVEGLALAARLLGLSHALLMQMDGLLAALPLSHENTAYLAMPHAAVAAGAQRLAAASDAAESLSGAIDNRTPAVRAQAESSR